MLAVAIVATAGVTLRRGDDPNGGAGAVVLVGDSLNVGTAPYLRDELSGWTVRDDSVVGRQTDEGLDALAARPAPSPSSSPSARTTRRIAAGFEADVAPRASRSRGPAGAWSGRRSGATAARTTAFNAVLRDAASANRRVRLVEWAEMARRDPELLAPDGLHGNEDGYRARAVAGRGGVTRLRSRPRR